MNNITDETEKLWLEATEAFNSGGKKLALEIFKNIADLGCGYAYTEIANIYELGGCGVEKDIEKAKKWYMMAANDVRDEDAYLALGRIYYLGLDGDIDYSKAYQYYSDEILENNAVALLRVGVMHHLGEGVKKDLKIAESMYKRSMKNKNIISIGYLSTLYFEDGRVFKGVMYRVMKVMFTLIALLSFGGRESFKK